MIQVHEVSAEDLSPAKSWAGGKLRLMLSDQPGRTLLGAARTLEDCSSLQVEKGLKSYKPPIQEREELLLESRHDHHSDLLC